MQKERIEEIRKRLSNPVIETVVNVVMGFAQKLSGKTYYPYQSIIGANIIRHTVAKSTLDLTVLLSRQSGKSTINSEVTAAMMVILPELAKAFGGECSTLQRFATNYKGAGTGGIRVGVFAPIFDQAQVVFQGVKGILESDNGKAILRELGLTLNVARGDTVSLSNNSRISCNSASEGSNIESATHDLVILDEAQDITTKVITKSIRPMLANTGGNMVYVGTCGAHRYDFYETISRNKNLQLEDKIERHFEFDYRFCSNYNEDYKYFVEGDIEKHGYDSDSVKMNYRLVWMLERGQFCTPQILYGTEGWIGRGMTDPTYGIHLQKKGARCYAGLDFGKESDSTVVTVLEVDQSPIAKHNKFGQVQTDSGIYYQKKVLNWLEIYGDDYESQYWEVIDFLANYDIDKMCVDATSQGDPIADRLITYLPNIYVEPIKFSEKQNSEMFKLVQQEMMAGRIKIPYDLASSQNFLVKKFCHQMLELEKEYRMQYMKVKHPPVRGAHDDFFSSLALAVWATQEASLPEVREDPVNLFRGQARESSFFRKDKNTMPFVQFS
jgi:hypothetical protein